MLDPSSEEGLELLPQLPSLSITESRDFYRDKLGFDRITYEDEGFLILSRVIGAQKLELHFWLTDDRSLCENSSVYVRGPGIDRLHAEFTGRGVEKITPLELRPWNMEEFYVWDPHGNLLKFGRPPLPVD